MNALLHTNNQHSTQLKLLNKLLLTFLIMLTTTSALAVNNFQQNILFTPSSSTLLAESKGRVMIYDGLKSDTVELAMNEQFDRIQHMMFVRTQYVQENGEYEADEDECD